MFDSDCSSHIPLTQYLSLTSLLPPPLGEAFGFSFGSVLLNVYIYYRNGPVISPWLKLCPEQWVELERSTVVVLLPISPCYVTPDKTGLWFRVSLGAGWTTLRLFLWNHPTCMKNCQKEELQTENGNITDLREEKLAPVLKVFSERWAYVAEKGRE